MTRKRTLTGDSPLGTATKLKAQKDLTKRPKPDTRDGGLTPMGGVGVVRPPLPSN